MLFIGDVHGKIEGYLNILARFPFDDTFQVGDMGVGLTQKDKLLSILSSEHRYIKGNHDDPTKEIGNWLMSGTHEFYPGMFFVNGAWSIDQRYLTPGLDWWPEEEHTEPEFERLLTEYAAEKPSIIVSHDCPHFFSRDNLRGIGGFPMIKTRTSHYLERMWDLHKPDLWVFGHWHQSVRKFVEGCEFICLDELEWVER